MADVLHDFTILALGDWEKEKMGSVISNWSNSSKQFGRIQNLDLVSDVEKIASLSDTSGDFKPPIQSRYIQRPPPSPVPAEKKEKPQNRSPKSHNQRDKASDGIPNSIPLCPHCRPEWKWGPRSYERNFWTLHPEQRPPSRRGRTKHSQN